MTDVQEPKRAWTPGPWRASQNEYLPRIDVCASDDVGTYIGEVRQRNSHDAELIALAPEMAEAILAIDNIVDFGSEGAWMQRVQLLADRLRRIGDKDD